MRSFTGITQQNFSGRLISKPTHVRDTKFGAQPPLPPSTLGMVIDWAGTYGASTSNPNVGVFVSLPVAGPRQTIDTIRSCRIDNTGNPVPVYVQFPDTPYIVVAPPNSVVWEPVETGSFDATIFGIGFTTGQIGVTAVYFCNFAVAPFIDYELSQSLALWKASASITRGNTIYNQNFGTPALGDQKVTTFLDLSGLNTTVIIRISGLPAPAFAYITCMDIRLTNLSGGANAGFVFESTGAAGIIFSWGFICSQVEPASCIENVTGMSMQLDATQNYRLRTTAIGIGIVRAELIFTINPT